MHTHSHSHRPHFAAPAALGARHRECMPRCKCVRCDKAIRDHLSEAQIDKMVRDSFPASDPPSVY